MKHILLAEDEEVTSYLLSNMLTNAGFNVTAAKNGKEALDILLNLKQTDQPVDLLLTDIQMPELSGLELIDSLQSRNIRLPVLVMTGFGDKDTVVQLLRKGCNDYIDKPFVKKDLLSRIDAIFKTVEDDQSSKKRNSDNIYNEKAELHREIETYRVNYENLRSQIDSAVTAYHDLIRYEKNVRIPVCIRSAPLSELGGDFIDIRDTESGCAIFIADVAGHDLGASYHTVLIKALLDEYHRNATDGVSFFYRLNRHLLENSKEERMVTAVFFFLDLKTMRGEIINAAHPPLICMTPGRTLPASLAHQDPVLGILEDITFQSRTFPIHPGDRFFLYTDGLINISRIDTADGNRLLLNESGLIQLLKQYRNCSVHDMIDKIWTDIRSYKFNDDILFVGLEIPERHGDNKEDSCRSIMR